MNTEKNTIVKAMDWLVNTLAMTLVSLFDGVKNAVDHANPSLFALVATLLPYALPLPVAFMTSRSAQQFFGWDAWAANVLGFGLEGLGLLCWVKLVDGILGEKDEMVSFLWGTAIAYEGLLIAINVVLAWRDGADIVYALTLLLVCLLPALSAAMYALHRKGVIAELGDERAQAQALAEKIRQERRADRKEAQALKWQYASDTKQEKLAPPFRRK